MAFENAYINNNENNPLIKNNFIDSPSPIFFERYSTLEPELIIGIVGYSKHNKENLFGVCWETNEEDVMSVVYFIQEHIDLDKEIITFSLVEGESSQEKAGNLIEELKKTFTATIIRPRKESDPNGEGQIVESHSLLKFEYKDEEQNDPIIKPIARVLCNSEEEIKVISERSPKSYREVISHCGYRKIIPENSWGIAPELKFTKFTSCIGIAGLTSEGSVFGIHLAVTDHLGTKKNMEKVVELINLHCDKQKQIIIFGYIDTWKMSAYEAYEYLVEKTAGYRKYDRSVGALVLCEEKYKTYKMTLECVAFWVAEKDVDGPKMVASDTNGNKVDVEKIRLPDNR